MKTLNGVAFNSKLNPELLPQIIPKSWEESFLDKYYLRDYSCFKTPLDLEEMLSDIRNQIQKAKLEVYKDIYKKFDNSPLAPADFLFWLSETINQMEKI
jgi:hypothetical protein